MGLTEISNTAPFRSMVERGWAWPARSSPQPPKAEVRRAWLEGAGHAHHNRYRHEGAGAVAKRDSVLPESWFSSRSDGTAATWRQARLAALRPERGHRRNGPQRRERDHRAPSRQGQASARATSRTAGQAVDSLLQRNSCSSIHMRCRTTANFRATATLALRSPIRLAKASPQSLSQDGLVSRLSTTLAASNR